MRCPRTVRLTAGALAIAAPTSAVALAADQPDAQSTLRITPTSSQLEYGHRLTITGVAPRADAGQRLALEFSAAHSPWRAIAHTKIHSDGAFRLRAPLTRSGSVRVGAAADATSDVGTASGVASKGTAPEGVATTGPAPEGVATTGTAPAGVATTETAADPAGTATGTAGAAVISASRSERVAVAAKLITSSGAIDALSGQRLELHGALLPRHAGRLVRLQDLAGGSWRTLTATRTRAGGHFALRYVDRASDRRTIRISFAGDSANAGVHSAGRKLIPLEPALASWYDDGGNTACGFHAADGIANKQLPCGTKVTLAYHGRTVTAVVDDRGPYVPGREFDLDQSTAGALGFAGVATIWSSVEPAPASARPPRAPSGPRRTLERKCPTGASPTSTWTRSTCRLSFGGGRSFEGEPLWWPEAGRDRS
jgi:hypothetical protein